MALDTIEIARQEIAKIYIAAFNRVPDSAGLNNWMNQYTAGLMSYEEIAADFANQAEYQAAYPAYMTDSEYITAIYNNVFGRAPDAEGLQNWINQIANPEISGITRGSVMREMLVAADADGNTDGMRLDNQATFAVQSILDEVPTDTATAQLVNITSDAATVDTATAAVAASATAGTAYALTIGTDTFTGTANDDTFTAGDTTATTWTVGDAINGDAGTDTFNIIRAAAITLPTAATVTNVETVNATSGATVTLNTTTGFTGLTTLNTTGVAGATVTAAATTAVSVTDSALAAGAIAVNGGSTVTVNSTGHTTGTIAVGATTAAAGAVSVTTAGVYVDGADNTVGAVAVTGGTTVGVTVNSGLTTAQTAGQHLDGTNNTETLSAVTVTGNASTTAVTVTQAAAVIEVDSATIGKIGIKNGAVTIADVNAASATAAGTLTTATINNYGNTTINSGALTTVNVSGTGGTLGITTGALTTAAVTTLALNLNGLSFKNAATNNAITVDADITTLNIGSSTATSTVNNITATGATTVNVSGDALLTLTDNTFAAATAINVTNTAGASFGTTAVGAAVTFTGGAGADSMIMTTGFTKANTMGAGNDTVTYNGAAGTGGSMAAGDGTDTIIMSGAEADAADASSVFNSKFTGFETLQLDDTMTVTVDLDGINAASKVILAAGTTSGTINNIASGGTVETRLDAAGAATLAVGVKSALVGATDVLNLQLTGSDIAAGTVTVANVETINIIMSDGATPIVADAGSITLTAAAATSIVVTGNTGIAVTATGSVAVTNFDASAIVNNSVAATTSAAAITDTAAELAVTYTSVNTTAAAAVTIKGGAGNDILTGSAAAVNVDTITGGEGADTITGGTGNDVIILTETTAAIDTVMLTATATNGVDTVRGFAAGTGIDVINLIHTETTVATADNAAAVFASTTTAALTTGASAFVLTGIATTTTLTDVVEITTTLSSYGNLGLSGATSGTELLKALSSTDTAATGITLDTASDDFYLIAYQNSNAYLYCVTDSGDTNAAAAEIALVGVYEGVAAGAFATGDFLA